MLQFAIPTVEPAVAAESQARFITECVAAQPRQGALP
jgi:hypothetical protein